MNTRTMYWNGNEIVFNDESSVGIAGLAPGQPDELAEEIVRRWNAVIISTLFVKDALLALEADDDQH